MFRCIFTILMLSASVSAQVYQIPQLAFIPPHWEYVSQGPSVAWSAAAYDQGQNQTVLFGGFPPFDNRAWRWNQLTQEWVRDTFVGPIRYSHTMTAVEDGIVLFGGRLSEWVFDDLWFVDAIHWERITISGTIPPSRYGHAMAYDYDNAQLILFGGRNEESMSDTWKCDLTKWKYITSDGPSARWGHSMIWDAISGKVWMFGGKNRRTIFADLWSWNGEKWIEHNIVGPSARWGHSMVWDNQNNRIILFGGVAEGVVQFNDVWYLSDNDGEIEWTEVSVYGRSPLIRSGHIATWQGTSMLMHGGFFSAVGDISDTWQFIP